MTLPNKFEICTKYNRTSRYVLTLNAEGYYEMAPAQRSLDDAYDVLKKYSQGFVKEALQDGMWEITANLDEHLSEPELVFPFYVVHRSYDPSIPENEMELFAGSEEGRVGYTFKGEVWDNAWSVSDAKRYIKDGHWIVKHVGEKATEAEAFTLGKGLVIRNGSMTASNVTIVPPPEAPQSTPLSSLSITITADTDAAVASVERLASAYEALNIAMESCLALNEKLKGLV